MIKRDILCEVAAEPNRVQSAGGVLDERRNSPGLLLALLGQDAMRRLRHAHTADNLSPRQFQLLGLLQDHGAITQSELGQTMNTDPSILVTLLNPLEADGLVLRERDPLDRRRHHVTLTRAGAEQLESAARAQRDAEDALFAGLNADQRDQLRTLLIALRDSLAAEHGSGCADGRVDLVTGPGHPSHNHHGS